MKYPHTTLIRGIPFGKPYMGKVKQAPLEWDAAIKFATQNWPLVEDVCLLRVTFLLPPNKFLDNKHLGPDLDNLMKRFLDALKHTVFRPPSDDSFVVTLEATKTKVSSDTEAGATLEIVPLQTLTRRKNAG